MMRPRNTPWDSASLVLAVPFVAVAILLSSCGDGGAKKASEANGVQFHQGAVSYTHLTLPTKA